MVKRLEMDANFLTTTLNWILNCPTNHLATRVLEETIRQMLTIELAHWATRTGMWIWSPCGNGTETSASAKSVVGFKRGI